MNNGTTILVDSDAFIGWLIANDAHHTQVKSALEKIDDMAGKLTTTSYVIAETTTLLSRHYSQENACQFLRYIHTSDFPVIEIVEQVRQQAEELFLTQRTEKISLIDCANVIAARRYNIQAILGFDRFYSRFDIPLVQ
ncbi:MAG: PIN domain-containing protein [Chloroflexi bacterium]|nr:PIN domain-containing protein [Chloroflexota bacterium]MCC6891441.1 type II toxin-antitoxin system VapC family toxin [Anaerolineae bacterium]